MSQTGKDGRVTGRWDRLDTPIPITFPRADSLTLGSAPDRCDRCGGVWRRVDEGLACYTCPRRWRTVEQLRAMIGRSFTKPERWPGVTRRTGLKRGFS